MAENDTVNIEVPEYDFFIQNGPDGNPLFFGIQISTSGTQHQFFLGPANENTVTTVKREFNQSFEKMLVGMKRARRSLIVPEGVNSNGLRTEGRK